MKTKPSNGYIDTVTLCNLAGLMQERRLTDWKKTKRAKDILLNLSEALGVPTEGKPGSGALIEYDPGKRAWLHPSLLEAYKAYLSNQVYAPSDSLYLIHAKDTDYYEIGVTGSKTRRLLRLQSGSPFELRYVATKESCVARELEQSILIELQPYRVRGEWFKLTRTLVRQVIEKWFTENS